MAGGCFDTLDGGGQVIERATTAGTADILCLGEPQSCGLQQGVGHGNLVLRRLAEADTYGVANAIYEQGSNSHSALQTTVLSLAGFCHPEVQREGHPFGIHRFAEQAHRFNHHYGVRCLDADDDIIKVLAHTYAKELHTRFYDAFGGVAISAHDTVAQGAVVHSDAYGGAIFTTDVQEGYEPVFDLLQFGGIFLVGILQILELPRCIDIVAGVDAHFLTIARRDVGHGGVEVHVGHEGHVTASSPHAFADNPHVLGFAHSLRRQPHQLAASSGNRQDLLHTPVGVHRTRRAHRLHPHGILSSDADIANAHFVGESSSSPAPRSPRGGESCVTAYIAMIHKKTL